jgi:predicted nucleic acid-binding protein
MPGNKIFLDTNILIYAFDVSAKEKHEQARKILLELWGSGRGLLSTQVLQEFFVSVTHKIPRTLTLEQAKEIVMDLLKWDVIVNDGESILEAVDIQTKQKFSFWDALILQAAMRGGASLLLSEDLSDGQIIRGVTIRNPFVRSAGIVGGA